MIHHLQIIGEAAARVSNELREKHPEVAWGGMLGMRHVLVDGYFETDKELVWRVVEQDIPTLKTQIEKILLNCKSACHKLELCDQIFEHGWFVLKPARSLAGVLFVIV